jgi:hypothetical protein
VVEANAAALLAINGAHGNLSNAKAARDDLVEQVVRVAIAFPERVPAHRSKRAAVEPYVAALRVLDAGP